MKAVNHVPGITLHSGLSDEILMNLARTSAAPLCDCG